MGGNHWLGCEALRRPTAQDELGCVADRRRINRRQDREDFRGQHLFHFNVSRFKRVGIQTI